MFYIQWLGDLQSRANIEGRLVLIEMICKDSLPQDYDNNFHQTVTPCISFRIAGTPSNYDKIRNKSSI